MGTTNQMNDNGYDKPDERQWVRQTRYTSMGTTNQMNDNGLHSIDKINVKEFCQGLLNVEYLCIS